MGSMQTEVAPNEYRIVRTPDHTAIYFRHTDSIYRAGTKTWFRKNVWNDKSGDIFRVIQETNNSYRVTTFDGRLTFAPELIEELEYEILAIPDRDWEAEFKQAAFDRESAERQLALAQQKFDLAVEKQARLQQDKDECDIAYQSAVGA